MSEVMRMAHEWTYWERRIYSSSLDVRGLTLDRRRRALSFYLPPANLQITDSRLLSRLSTLLGTKRITLVTGRIAGQKSFVLTKVIAQGVKVPRTPRGLYRVATIGTMSLFG